MQEALLKTNTKLADTKTLKKWLIFKDHAVRGNLAITIAWRLLFTELWENPNVLWSSRSSRSGRMIYGALLWHARSYFWTPTNACVYMICKYADQKGLAATLTHTVSRCCTIGESEDHTGEKPHKEGIYPGFETLDRGHQKSKTGVSVAPQEGLVSFKKFCLKKRLSHICLCVRAQRWYWNVFSTLCKSHFVKKKMFIFHHNMFGLRKNSIVPKLLRESRIVSKASLQHFLLQAKYMNITKTRTI